MFNRIISGKPPPKYLSSDNDLLFLFHRWKANLRILEIEEIKSIAGVPQSHPFIERTIKSIRTEFLDHTLFFNSRDLQRKLNSFQKYYNDTRGHSSLEMNTPSQMASNENANKKVAHWRVIVGKHTVMDCTNIRLPHKISISHTTHY